MEFRDIFQQNERTSVDLKDKFRNLGTQANRQMSTRNGATKRVKLIKQAPPLELRTSRSFHSTVSQPSKSDHFVVLHEDVIRQTLVYYSEENKDVIPVVVVDVKRHTLVQELIEVAKREFQVATNQFVILVSNQTGEELNPTSKITRDYDLIEVRRVRAASREVVTREVVLPLITKNQKCHPNE